ncbi:MAG: VanZ family protein, partial [Chloroflexota bacterium]
MVLGPYTLPLLVTVLVFPFVAMLALVPFAYYHYRRYGRLGRLNTLVFYSFVLYGLALVFYVTLPLPAITPNFCQTQGVAPQLRPFQFLRDLVREVPHLTIVSVVRSRVFLQVFFNVLFFVPLGVYLRYYLNQPFARSVAIAFGTSLFLETTQLTGLWGIYPCAYRHFDVDDLLLNTTGGLLGYATATALALPRPVVRASRAGRPVSASRRFVGLLIDAVAVYGGAVAAYITIAAALFWLAGYSHPAMDGTLIRSELLFLAGLLDFLALPFLLRGVTFGKWVVRIRLVGPGASRPTAGNILVRYAVFVLPLTALEVGKAVAAFAAEPAA